MTLVLRASLHSVLLLLLLNAGSGSGAQLPDLKVGLLLPEKRPYKGDIYKKVCDAAIEDMQKQGIIKDTTRITYNGLVSSSCCSVLELLTTRTYPSHLKKNTFELYEHLLTAGR